MTALKVIGIILLILLLLSLLRVGVIVRFGEELAVKLRIGPVCMAVLPKNEEKAKKQRKEKKPKEEAAETGESKKKRSLPRPTPGELKELLSTVFSALGAVLRAVCRRLRIDPLEISVTFGGTDPADIAQAYGYASAAMWTLMPHAEELFNIPHPSLHLNMDYSAEKTAVKGSAGLSFRIGDIIAIAFTLVVPLLKWYLRFKKAHSHDAPPAHQEGAAGEEPAGKQKQSEKLTA